MKEIVPFSERVSQNFFCSDGITSDSYCYLSDDSKKDAEWDKWRSDSQAIEELLMMGDEDWVHRYAERMRNCSKSLLFALEANSEGEIKHRLKEVRFCRFRHCAVCQARRSRRNYALFLKSLPGILSGNEGARWVFLTLTVPNVLICELRDELKRMNVGWHRFIKLKEFKKPGQGNLPAA